MSKKKEDTPTTPDPREESSKEKLANALADFRSSIVGKLPDLKDRLDKESDAEYARRMASAFLYESYGVMALNLTSYDPDVRNRSARTLSELAIGKAGTQEPPEDTSVHPTMIMDLPYGSSKKSQAS